MRGEYTKGGKGVGPQSYNILVVCTANRCRSPMAVGLLRGMLQEVGLADRVAVTSAGVWAADGEEAAPLGVELLEERGVDIRDHRSRGLGYRDILVADLILVMEEAHRNSIYHWAPASLSKVMLLSELVGKHRDIPDPFGQERDQYESVLAEMEGYLARGWETLLRQVGVPSTWGRPLPQRSSSQAKQ